MFSSKLSQTGLTSLGLIVLALAGMFLYYLFKSRSEGVLQTIR